MIHLKYNKHILIFRTNNKEIFNKYLKIANSFRNLNILLRSEYNNNVLFEYEYNGIGILKESAVLNSF